MQRILLEKCKRYSVILAGNMFLLKAVDTAYRQQRIDATEAGNSVLVRVRTRPGVAVSTFRCVQFSE